MHKKIFVLSIIFIFIFIFAFLFHDTFKGYCSDNTVKIQNLAEKFVHKYGKDVEIIWDENTGFPISISNFKMSSYKGTSEEIAYSFLSEHSSLLGIKIYDIEFSACYKYHDFNIVKFNQVYKDIRVSGAKVHVNIAKDGSVNEITKIKYCHDIDLDIIPVITPKKVVAVVMNDLNIMGLITERKEIITLNLGFIFQGAGGIPKEEIIEFKYKLIIFCTEKDKACLCWEIKFYYNDQENLYIYYIDAHTGRIIKSFKDY